MDQKPQSTIPVPVDFIGAISHASSLEQVLLTAAERLPHMVGSDYSVVTFIDEGRQISRAFERAGVTGVFGPDTQIYPGTYGAQVLETGEPRLINSDMMRSARIGLMPQMYQAGIRSVLVAPMKSGGKTVGALTIANRHEHQFSDRHVTFVVAIGKWIASQARLMQQVRRTARLAETDMLTGLANRARVMRVLDGPESLHKADSKGRILGVLHIDLDHFKEVNDTLGHAAGDAILKHAAAAMTRVVGPKDLVARIGGDEFLVATRSDPHGAHLTQLGHKIVDAISQPVRIGDVEARVGVSIGTALASRKDDSADRLIGNADMALYEVKRRGRGEVHKFTETMRQANERRIQLISDLQGAIDSGDFLPYFQPQVSMRTGMFSGFEVLARWDHEKLGILDPSQFLQLVDQVGLSLKIDGIVRRKAIAAMGQLRRDGWQVPRMSFNASARTLSDPNLVNSLLTETQSHGLGAQDLVLQIREADLLELGRFRAIDVIKTLGQNGLRVELEDFGSGRVSASTLIHADVHAIKFHDSMVALLPGYRAKKILSRSIELAHELGVTVVARGVETAEQYAELRGMNCDIAQGYGISKPLPFADLVAFMAGYGKAPVSLAKPQSSAIA